MNRINSPTANNGIPKLYSKNIILSGENQKSIQIPLSDSEFGFKKFFASIFFQPFGVNLKNNNQFKVRQAQKDEKVLRFFKRKKFQPALENFLKKVEFGLFFLKQNSAELSLILLMKQ